MDRTGAETSKNKKKKKKGKSEKRNVRIITQIELLAVLLLIISRSPVPGNLFKA